MTEAFTPHDAARERLSALVDGELDPGAVTQACQSWREAGALRAAWHEYQLIGDVLRSSELASPARHDVAFLHRLRERMVDEPVVLAPARPAAIPRAGLLRVALRRGGWLATSAAAAGFVAVVAFGVIGRPAGPLADRGAGSPPGAGGVELARSGSSGATPLTAATLAPPPMDAERAALAPGGAFLHDPRLDRYLEAHQEFAGSSALGVPSAFLRSATLVNAADH